MSQQKLHTINKICFKSIFYRKHGVISILDNYTTNVKTLVDTRMSTVH